MNQMHGYSVTLSIFLDLARLRNQLAQRKNDTRHQMCPKYYSHDYSSLPLGLLNECELRGSRDVKSISGWSKDGKTAKTCASLDEFEMCRREL